MGAITNKCFELLESGNNFEEHRSTGIIIKSNWFDALDGRETTVRTSKEAGRIGSIEEREFAKKSALAINDIP